MFNPRDAASRNSRGHGHVPLNQGMRYATFEMGHDIGDVMAKTIAWWARSMFMYVALQLRASTLKLSRPLPAWVYHCGGRFTAALSLPP